MRTVRDVDTAPAPIDAHSGKAQPQIHGVIQVMLGMADDQAIARQGARQEFLRQRRPLVRQHRFISDQGDGALVPSPAQGFDCLTGGLAATDDHHLLLHSRDTY
jgi:hypothetical protein